MKLRFKRVLGVLVSAAALAGCSAGGTSTEPATKPAAAPAVAEAPAPARGGRAKKAPVDTTSRRQHQQQQAGQTPASP